MQRRFVSLMAAVVLGTLAAAQAHAETYTHPEGYSFQIPEGWVAVDPSVSQKIAEYPESVQQWFRENPEALNRISVVVLKVTSPEDFATLNVVVNPQQMPITTATLDVLKSTVPTEYAKAGVTITDLNAVIQPAAARDAVHLDYKMQFSGDPIAHQQRQIHLPSAGKTYIITCSSPESLFAASAPDFDSMLASFQAPPAAPETRAKGFDIRSVGRYGLIGAIAGGLFGLFGKLFGIGSRSQAKPQ